MQGCRPFGASSCFWPMAASQAWSISYAIGSPDWGAALLSPGRQAAPDRGDRHGDGDHPGPSRPRGLCHLAHPQSTQVSGLLIETEGELRKVTWPSTAETWSGTIAVIITVVLMLCFLYASDLVLSGLLSRLMGGQMMALEWYFLRVQVGREDRIRKNMVARLKQAGHEDKVPQVIVPTETVADHRGGKRRIRKKKLYPGYLMVEMELTDDVWFVLRETPVSATSSVAAARRPR